MELTVIKIPGKNKQDKSKAARAAKENVKRKPGRPMKRPAPKDEKITYEDAPKKMKKPRSLRNIKSKRKMSNLEKLPTEILEQVFFACLSLDLPRCSPIIASKVSSEIIYQHVLNAAFVSTWDSQIPGLQCPTKLEGTLQSDAFSCRWVSVPRILRAKASWIVKSDYFQLLRRPLFLDLGTQNDRNAKKSDYEIFSNLTAEEHFKIDFERFCNFADSPDAGHELAKQGYEVNTEPIHDVAPTFELPDHLLSGPWEENSIQLMFWLARAGARVDWINSTSGETATEGLKTAISTANMRAIVLLVWLGLSKTIDSNLVVWAYGNAGGEDPRPVVNFFWGLAWRFEKDERDKIAIRLADMKDNAAREQDTRKLESLLYISSKDKPPKRGWDIKFWDKLRKS